MSDDNRRCTDKLCLVIFLVGLAVLGGVAGKAYKSGDPMLLTNVYDADHKACGLDAEVKDYPLLYWAKPLPGYLNHTVCVKKCPSEDAETKLDCMVNSVITSCEEAAGGDLDLH